MLLMHESCYTWRYVEIFVERYTCLIIVAEQTSYALQASLPTTKVHGPSGNRSPAKEM